MTSTNRKSRLTQVGIAATGVALAATTLAGCSHDSGTKTAASQHTSSTVVAAPKPDNIVNDPKARPSVSMKDCAQTSSGWTAGGTVTNSTAKNQTFTIVVSFTTKQSTVLTRGATKVTVKPSATKSWTTAASFAKTKGVQCVLRGVSAT